jgi:hypothetical protein
MRHLKQLGLALLAVTVVASSASAQRTQSRSRSSNQRALWELGMDAGLQFDLSVPAGSTKATTLSIPVPSVRAGVWASDVLSIEPFLGLQRTSGGGASVTGYNIGVGGLYHFSPERNQSQVYVRPFLFLQGASFKNGGVSNSNSDVGVGVGAGMKWPKLGGRLALRGEGNIATVNSTTSLNLLFGFSFFTR